MEKHEVWHWKDLELMETADIESEYEKRQLEIVPNQCCAVLYTSGTTGQPKGVMISHDNFTWTLKALATRLNICPCNQEVFMTYLPVSHMAGQIFDVFLSFYVAATVYFADKNAIKASFLDTLAETRPTLFIGVPRIYEKIQAKSMKQDKTLEFSKNALESLSIDFPTEKFLNEKKRDLGLDRCKNLIFAAAPSELKNYFLSLNLFLKNFCGMTEVTVHCGSTLDAPQDSVGKALDGVETKILNPNSFGVGEICVRTDRLLEAKKHSININSIHQHQLITLFYSRNY